MRRSGNAGPVLCGVLIVALVSAGCRPEEPGSQGSLPPAATPLPVRGGTAVIGLVMDLDSWNPYLNDLEVATDVLALLYPWLAIEQPDYREHPPSFTPNLAESWQWSDDRLVCTLHLRQEATWSDGVPVTADDVVFSWRVQTSPQVGWTSGYVKDSIERVEAVDAKTVQVIFSRRYPYQMVDLNDGLIVPAHLWSKIGFERWSETDWKEQALSAGPFRLASHSPHQEIVLERNGSYWDRQRPLLDRVVYRIVPDQTSLLTQLRTGVLDLINVVPPRQAERVRQAPETDLVIFDDRRYEYIGWNNDHPILADVAVRRALTMAIDRETILEATLGGAGRVAVGPVLSSMWACNQALQPLPFDPEQARALLAEAGWRDSDGDGVLDRSGARFELELLCSSDVQTRRDAAVLVAEQLARVGVVATPRLLEWGAISARLDSGDFDAVLSGWREPTQIDLEDLWHSPEPGVPSSNFIRYANPEVDRLIGEVNAATSFDVQKPLLDRIQEIIVAEQPYTFLFERQRWSGVSTRLHGAVINDASPYFNIEDWYVSGPPTG